MGARDHHPQGYGWNSRENALCAFDRGPLPVGSPHAKKHEIREKSPT